MVGPGRDVVVETSAGTVVDFTGAFDSDQDVIVFDGDAATTPPPSPHATLVGTPLVVELDREPTNPVEIRFETTAPVGEDPTLVASNASGAWEVVLGSYDPETSTITARVPHFDWWAPWTWCVFCVADSASQQIGRLLGNRAGPPNCSEAEPEWVRDAYTDDSPSAVLVGCVTSNSGQLEVRLVNNRSYGMIVTSPVPFSYVALDSPLPLNDIARSSLGPERFERLSNNYLDSAVDAPTVDWLFLPPTTTAFIGIDRPDTSLFSLTAERTGETIMLDVTVALLDAALNDVAASSLTQALFLLMVSCHLIPWATTSPPTSAAELVDWLRLLGRCAAEAVEEAAQPPVDPAPFSGSELVHIRNLKELLAAIDLWEFAGKMGDNIADAIVNQIALPRYTVLTAPLPVEVAAPELLGCPDELNRAVDEAVLFVCLVLTDGEVETLLATTELTGPEEADSIPFDPQPLISRFGQIRAFAPDTAMVRASPDAHPDSADPLLAPSCDFSHGLWCEVDLLADNDETIASIEVRWYGNGITDFVVVWERPPPVSNDVAALQARWLELQTACRGGPGNDPATLEACDEWLVVADELGALGWCHGRTDPNSVTTEWFRCEG